MVDSANYIYTVWKTFVCRCGWTVPTDERDDDIHAESAVRLHLLTAHGLPTTALHRSGLTQDSTDIPNDN
jgi:hypothetical protein